MEDFKTLQEIRDFLEISTKKEREERLADFKKVEKLFNTDLLSVFSSINEKFPNLELTADFYVDYNKKNNYGKAKTIFEDEDGVVQIKYSIKDVFVNDLVIVYSLFDEKTGRKTPIAFKKTKRTNFDEEAQNCLEKENLQNVNINLLFNNEYVLSVRKSLINDTSNKRGQFVEQNAKNARIEGRKIIENIHVTREGEMHEIMWDYPEIGNALWNVVEQNVEKMQAAEIKKIIGEIKSRRKLLGHFCEDSEELKQNIEIENTLIAAHPEDKENRERLKSFFKNELEVKEEYKLQEKSIIASLHNDVKTLKISDAKDNLKIIIR